MNKRFTILLLLFCCLLIGKTGAFAQTTTEPGNNKIVLFLPLHLDSIFDAESKYRYKPNVFPRFVGTPLEFYQGFVEAMNTLKAAPGNIDIEVIDIRAFDPKGLGLLADADSIHHAQAWIMYGNANESRALAEAARKYQIPLVNVNLPNDAGIGTNPYYFICNPTLTTQCDGIYRHLQQYYALQEIVLVRKKGGLDDRILNIWEELGRNNPGVPLNYQVIEVADSIPSNLLKSKLDSTKETILFGASLDENFARTLAKAVAELPSAGYKVELMGMSTWDNVREFSNGKFRNLSTVIPTPYNYNRADTRIKDLQTKYQDVYYGKISDLYLRGYELATLLYKPLQKTPADVVGLLPGKKKLAFSEMDWQPVLHRQNLTLEYFENKKLYFVKRMDGSVRSVR